MTVTHAYTGALETGFAQLDHGTLYYERLGSGTPIVLMHGLSLDTRMWNGVFEKLAERYQVIRIDLRGFGRSEATTEPFSVYEDVRALLDFLKLDSAFLVGHSMSGTMILDFALAYPERTLGLVFVAGALIGHPPSELAKETQAHLQELFQKGDLEAALEYDVVILLDGPQATPGRVEGPTRELLKEIRRHAYTLEFNGNFPKPLEPFAITRLEEVQAPMLTIYGDLDWPHFKEISDAIATRVPNAQQVLMPGTAHNGCMEKPEEFAQLVLDFLAEK